MTPVNGEAAPICRYMPQKDYAAAKPGVIYDHVHKSDCANDHSVLKNTQESCDQHEVDRTQQISHPLAGKHPTRVPNQGMSRKELCHKALNVHDANPRRKEWYCSAVLAHRK